MRKRHDGDVPELAMGVGGVLPRRGLGADLEIGVAQAPSRRPIRIAAAIGIVGPGHARPIADQLPLHGAVSSTQTERRSGLAAEVLSERAPGPDDVLVVFSTSASCLATLPEMSVALTTPTLP